MELPTTDLSPSGIPAREAFEIAMRVGAVVGGSTTMALRPISAAKEAGLDKSLYARIAQVTMH